MIIVIQCASKKVTDAGYLQRRDGQKVLFVAQPDLAPDSPDLGYAKPDDVTDTGRSWRAELVSYSNDPGTNPLGLLPARQLYQNKTYGRLADQYGTENLYILSAGWGLIGADFLTPAYDITFSASAEGYKRRRKADHYDDLHMLPKETDEPVVFFGGKDYVGLFCELTRGIRGPRHVFFNSANPPNAPGCTLQRFETTTRTNWHYECAGAFMGGDLGL